MTNKCREILNHLQLKEEVFGNIGMKDCNKIHMRPRMDILGIPDATFAMLVYSKGQKQVAERLLKSTEHVTYLH